VKILCKRVKSWSFWIFGFLRLISIMIILYLNFKFIYYTQNWSKYYKYNPIFSVQNLSLKIPTIQDPHQNSLVPPTF
jgi:hypothetical protein